MTVGELIEKLDIAPDDAVVRIDVAISTDCSGYLHLTDVRFADGLAVLDAE